MLYYYLSDANVYYFHYVPRRLSAEQKWWESERGGEHRVYSHRRRSQKKEAESGTGDWPQSLGWHARMVTPGRDQRSVHLELGFATALHAQFERRGDNLKDFNDTYPKAKSRIGL